MKKIITFLLLLQSPNLAFASHEFYVSICDIEHNTESNSLEITLKVFTHDFERAISETFNEQLHLGTSKEHPNAAKFIASYLQEYLQIRVNQNLNTTFHYLGKEVEVNETYCYLEIEGVHELHNIEVRNFLLLQSFPKQSNIVNIRANNRLESMLLNKDKTNDRVEY